MPSSPGNEDLKGAATQERAALSETERLAPADGAAGAPAEQEDLRAELEAAREQLAYLDDRYRRALADLDNLRKRTARDAERRAAEAREQILRDWLEALDSVERALALTPDDAGARALLGQMETILARHGVTRVGAPGEPFDPVYHEAVAVAPAEGVADRSIVEVARPGFALDGERVLRPAQVVVAKAAREEAG